MSVLGQNRITATAVPAAEAAKMSSQPNRKWPAILCPSSIVLSLLEPSCWRLCSTLIWVVWSEVCGRGVASQWSGCSPKVSLPWMLPSCLSSCCLCHRALTCRSSPMATSAESWQKRYRTPSPSVLPSSFKPPEAHNQQALTQVSRSFRLIPACVLGLACHTHTPDLPSHISTYSL